MKFHICAAGMKRARVEEGAEGLVGPFRFFGYFFWKKVTAQYGIQTFPKIGKTSSNQLINTLSQRPRAAY